MNYKTVANLKGNTLAIGDLVGICSIGHKICEGTVQNLGGCGDLWFFDKLDITSPESFVSGIGGHAIWIDEDNDIVGFLPNRLDLITNLVLELMKLSEEQGWDKDYEEE